MNPIYRVKGKVKFEDKWVNNVLVKTTRLIPMLDDTGSVEFMRKGCPPKRMNEQGTVATWEYMAIIKSPVNSPCRIGSHRGENGGCYIHIMNRAVSQEIQKRCLEGAILEVHVMHQGYDLEHVAENSEKAVEGNYRVGPV